MIIAQEKRKTNIAEFILYMWQVEDLIRSSQFDILNIDQNVIRKYTLPPETIKEIRTWYENLITLMMEESLQKRGHMSFLNQLIRQLNDLHLRLLQSDEEKKYQLLYEDSRDNIQEFIKKSTETFSSEIEVCLTGLYGYLMLRLQQAEVSQDTRKAMESFSNLLAALSTRFRELEEAKGK